MIEKQIIQNLQLSDEAKNDVTASVDNSLRDPLLSSEAESSQKLFYYSFKIIHTLTKTPTSIDVKFPSSFACSSTNSGYKEMLNLVDTLQNNSRWHPWSCIFAVRLLCL